MKGLINFSLHNKLVVFLSFGVLITFGVIVAPFNWQIPFLPNSPIPVDAIPNIGENQQIIFTEWAGRSPKDVEDQVTYPLTSSLLGIADVKSVRSFSYFGFSSIYVVFKESASWDWSRAKITEKLTSLAPGTLPAGVNPTLGPDATALGQVFWYTLEGKDKNGKTTGGWDLHELRSIQDFQVKYALQSADGVAEVASIGGFVKEYQVDVNPDAMRAFGINLQEVFKSVKNSNLDVSARTIEINKVEYVIRGLGYIKDIKDLENTVVTAHNGQPIYLKQIANINFGPATRRGALDKGGAEVVGGVVVTRYGANPLQTINNIKNKIKEIDSLLPSKTLEDGTTSQVQIVPFYDRSKLIQETLDTLNHALVLEILITILVIILILSKLRAALLISIMLPISVLFTFIAMKIFKIDANIVALSGIAIAIGTIVDIGIVIIESIIRKIDKKTDGERVSLKDILDATLEVSGAVFTAVLTTVISFIPIFGMIGSEGKLFRPLAFTKTFALLSSIIIAVILLPPLAHMLLRKVKKKRRQRTAKLNLPVWILAIIVLVFLALHWHPLEIGNAFMEAIFNIILVAVLIVIFMVGLKLFLKFYPKMLKFMLKQKLAIIIPVLALVITGGLIWKKLGREFMPSLDEGSFLFMPTTMPHASFGQALDILQMQDKIIANIPEVASVVGKIGRVESALDPAPVSMVETVINYKPEWGTNEDGERIRNWRSHIKTPNDIWEEIAKKTQMPGVTGAPKLQPIETRLVMLQTGMRAPLGIKIFGSDLETMENFGLELEKFLKEIPEIKTASVFADRIVGKPYLEIKLDRNKMSRYGMSIKTVQDILEVAIGGKTLTQTVEGRERYAVRLRYQRERRSSIEDLQKILVSGSNGEQIPLRQIAEINYTKGTQMIKSEDNFFVSYVIFDKKDEFAEVEVVNKAKEFLRQKQESGDLKVQQGITYKFTGSYENQIRASKKLMLLVPLALILIFILLYFLFKNIPITLIVFTNVFLAWSGGFILIWFYNQSWFLNLDILGLNLRDLFNVKPINLSVAVWAGFLALFGIATDHGVLMANKIQQNLQKVKSKRLSKKALHKLVLESATERCRPALMTIATTILALLPILTSSGRGSDIMIPMAIPTFGGMLIGTLALFLVPVLYLYYEEKKVSYKS